MEEDVARAGGEIVTLPVASKSPFTIPRHIGRLTKLIRDRKVDLVHARSRAPAWSALLAARAPASLSSPPITAPMARVGPFKAAYNSVMARGDRVIANSRYTASVDRGACATCQGSHPRHLPRRRPQRLRSCRRRCARGRRTQGCLGRSSRHQDRAPRRAASPASRGSAT